MELHKKEKEHKYVLALIRERDELWNQKHNIAPIKLDNPIQHGYVRTLELRDDVKYRIDYPEILKVINFLGQYKKYHRDKDFINRNKKNSVEQHAHLKTLIDPRFRFYYTEAKRAEDIEKIKSMEKYLWYHNSVYDCSCNDLRENLKVNQFKPHYYFKFPWMLKEITKPHYLTHYSPVEGNLESRLAKISAELYNNSYYEKFIDNRKIYDKIDKENWLSVKYNNNKSIIYHAVNQNDIDI